MTDPSVHEVVAEPVTAAAWAPFGWLPRPDTDPADGEHTLRFEWDDAHLNTIEHTTDEIDATAGGLRCAVMYRHETHTQVLSPLDAASVRRGGARHRPRSRLPQTSRPSARSCSCPARPWCSTSGTWHWGPFPIRGATSVRLLNVQGRRYAEDNASVDLSSSLIEVRA